MKMISFSIWDGNKTWYINLVKEHPTLQDLVEFIPKSFTGTYKTYIADALSKDILCTITVDDPASIPQANFAKEGAESIEISSISGANITVLEDKSIDLTLFIKIKPKLVPISIQLGDIKIKHPIDLSKTIGTTCLDLSKKLNYDLYDLCCIVRDCSNGDILCYVKDEELITSCTVHNGFNMYAKEITGVTLSLDDTNKYKKPALILDVTLQFID